MPKTKSEKEVVWTGSKTCDFCHKEISDILIDGKTMMGPWATMCPSCHRFYGYKRFGTGIGQKYKKNSDGKFIKIEG